MNIFKEAWLGNFLSYSGTNSFVSTWDYLTNCLITRHICGTKEVMSNVAKINGLECLIMSPEAAN